MKPARLPAALCQSGGLLAGGLLAGLLALGAPAPASAQDSAAAGGALPDEPTAALVGLLRANRRSPLPEAETQEVRRELITAIDDPVSAPPPGVLEFIARSEEADETVLRSAFGLV